MVAPVIVAGFVSTGGTLTAKAMAGKWTVGLMVAVASYFYWEDDSRHPRDNEKFTQLTRDLNATVTGLDAIMSASVDCTKLENRADPKCFSVNVDKRHNFANTSKQFGTFAADLCKRASAGTSDMLKHSSARRYAMFPIHATWYPKHTWTTNYVKSDDPVCSDMAAKASNVFTNLKNTFPKSKDAKENAELHARMIQAQNTSMTLGQGTGPVRVKTYPALQQFMWTYGCQYVFSPERWDTYDGWEMIALVIVGLVVLGLAGAALRPWFMNLKDSCAFLKTVRDAFPLIVGGTVYAYAMYNVPDNRWWITCIAIVVGLACYFWCEFFPKSSGNTEPTSVARTKATTKRARGSASNSSVMNRMFRERHHDLYDTMRADVIGPMESMVSCHAEHQHDTNFDREAFFAKCLDAKRKETSGHKERRLALCNDEAPPLRKHAAADRSVVPLNPRATTKALPAQRVPFKLSREAERDLAEWG